MKRRLSVALALAATYLVAEVIGGFLRGAWPSSDVNLATLRQVLGNIAGVQGVHDLHVWTLTSGYAAMSCHLVIDDEALLRPVLDVARDVATGNFNIRHVTVQVEPRGVEEREAHL